MYQESETAGLAAKYINNTNRHIFLTGKAGTGKTTFLKNLISHTYKNTVIVAPTGIAAINAGGATIHSQFQLPFGSFIPENIAQSGFNSQLHGRVHIPKTLIEHLQMTSVRRKVLREVELLVIDEVSMLRADILDAMDVVLRHVRRKNTPFGGVQILFIGDLLQLPPVIKRDESQLLKPYYPSIFFFNALALKENPPLYIELDKIYRQSDQEFIDVLNNLRHNKILPEDQAILNRYVNPDYEKLMQEKYIFLTTHNRKATDINQKELQNLQGKEYTYKADIYSAFPESMFPIDTDLILKEGAQVMFIKNDYSGNQRYFNGKIATVSRLEKNKVFVNLNDGTEEFEVDQYEWENKQFKLNEKNGDIEEKVKGTFTHFPLRLAWAITIHKSQGLTFEKAIIDLENTFAPGQIYVALSRLTSLNGLALTKALHQPNVQNDSSVTQYISTRDKKEQLQDRLEQESLAFSFNENQKTFDFAFIGYSITQFIDSFSMKEYKSRKMHDFEWATTIQGQLLELVRIGNGFKNQIAKIYHSEDPKTVLLKRVIDAKTYFEPILDKTVLSVDQKLKELKGEKGINNYTSELKDLRGILHLKQQKISQSEDFTLAAINQEVYKKPSTKSKPKAARNSSKEATHLITLKQFEEGLSINDIAEARSLVPTTIESHLAKCVEDGLLDPSLFLTDSNRKLILEAADKLEEVKLNPLKEHFENRYSYFELKLALLDYKK